MPLFSHCPVDPWHLLRGQLTPQMLFLIGALIKSVCCFQVPIKPGRTKYHYHCLSRNELKLSGRGAERLSEIELGCTSFFLRNGKQSRKENGIKGGDKKIRGQNQREEGFWSAFTLLQLCPDLASSLSACPEG